VENLSQVIYLYMPSAFYNTDCIKAASQHENNTTQISNIVEY